MFKVNHLLTIYTLLLNMLKIKFKIIKQELFKYRLKYVQIVLILMTLFFLPVLAAQSIQDLQRLKKEYEDFQNAGEITKQSNLPNQGNNPLTGLPDVARVTPYRLDDQLLDNRKEKELKYFGYEFFTKRDTVSFWESLPTPANYQLGPGDELVVSVWGETQWRETYTINREGKIYDTKVGLLNLAGKDLKVARSYLKEQFGRIYATLKGESPSTFIDISLGELRSINVNFVGEVQYPGVYPVHPFSNVITGLIQAGGIDTTGSLRKIQVKRNGKLALTVDLYDYLIRGNLPNNIQLRDQDIIVVPVRASTVEVDSAVVNSGVYEGVEGESIFDLVQFAGGLKTNAADNIALSRIKPLKERGSKSIYEGYYIDLDQAKLIPIQNGDRIFVREIFKEDRQVEIIGQVKNPGIYHYYNGMTLKNLLTLGGGFNDTTFWKSVYHNQAEIIRLDSKSRYSEIIKLSLIDLYNGNSEEDLQLQNLDKVVIHANLNYYEKENIYISGEVNIPGAYPLISDRETLKSFISRAGNLTSKALKNGITIYRDTKYFETTLVQDLVPSDIEDQDIEDYNEYNNAKNVNEDRIRVAWQNDSITLMPGDSIVVKESTGTVNVSGQIYNPGLIEYNSRKSLRHYINAAGGITERGNKKSIIVIYANGVVSPKKWYSTPKIEDGSTIIVNQKELEEPFDITQFATNWTSILSSMITAIVLSKQL